MYYLKYTLGQVSLKYFKFMQKKIKQQLKTKTKAPLNIFGFLLHSVFRN